MDFVLYDRNTPPISSVERVCRPKRVIIFSPLCLHTSALTCSWGEFHGGICLHRKNRVVPQLQTCQVQQVVLGPGNPKCLDAEQGARAMQRQSNFSPWYQKWARWFGPRPGDTEGDCDCDRSNRKISQNKSSRRAKMEMPGAAAQVGPGDAAAVFNVLLLSYGLWLCERSDLRLLQSQLGVMKSGGIDCV